MDTYNKNKIKKDRKSRRTRQKNKRGDRTQESTDSPEIPDRKKTSDICSLPLGVQQNRKCPHTMQQEEEREVCLLWGQVESSYSGAI